MLESETKIWIIPLGGHCINQPVLGRWALVSIALQPVPAETPAAGAKSRRGRHENSLMSIASLLRVFPLLGFSVVNHKNKPQGLGV